MTGLCIVMRGLVAFVKVRHKCQKLQTTDDGFRKIDCRNRIRVKLRSLAFDVAQTAGRETGLREEFSRPSPVVGALGRD